MLRREMIENGYRDIGVGDYLGVTFIKWFFLMGTREVMKDVGYISGLCIRICLEWLLLVLE